MVIYIHLSGFNANATGYNGSFSGPCIIHLDHQAITIIYEQDEVEIAKWPFSCIRGFNFDEPGKFSFVSGNKGPFGVEEYTFEVHNVKTLEHTLRQFIGMQISQSRSKPQPYNYLQCQCAKEKKHLSDSVDGRSIFVSHGSRVAKIQYARPLPGPTRDCLHLPAEVSDPVHLTGGGFPLRHSFSTGDLLESSSSFPPRQVSHKTHVRLYVSLSGEGPCIVEDEQHQSTSTQCTSGDVPALLPRE